MAVISRLGEFGLIEQLTGQVKAHLPTGVVGPGDDCAVIPFSALGLTAEKKQSLLVTTDTLVENVHFDRSFSSAADIGWKLAAVNLSDIAAMGGEPRFAVISLQLRKESTTEWAEELYRGMNQLLNDHDTMLVGGDTVAGNEISLTLTLFGIASDSPILRSGAKEGDDVWLSGSIGGAAAGLKLLREKQSGPESLLSRHRRPRPQIALGRALAETQVATSMIDVSDGLLADALHLAEQSNVSLTLNLKDVPFQKGGETIISKPQMLTGGDDYELLFTASPAGRSTIESLLSISPIARIGTVAKASLGKGDLTIIDDSGASFSVEKYLLANKIESAGGFRHF